MKNIKLFENFDENKALSLHIEHGPLMFTFSLDDLEDDKVYGVLKFNNKLYKGFFEYTEKSGIGWALKTSSNEQFTADMVEDSHPDEWSDFTNEIITTIQDEEH